MKTRAAIIFTLLGILVAAPMALRWGVQAPTARMADDRLVIITPQNESIRQEFGNAFVAHWRQTTGRELYVDWRTPGGSSEIRRVLDAGYAAAAERGSDGIGVDVLFGGGEPDFTAQAKRHRLSKLRVFESHPEWFEGDFPIIPSSHTGERFIGQDQDWVGVCLSQFGICYNPQVIARLGLEPPKQWSDLADPRYFGHIALSDPTMSGSVARAFELLVQAEMKREIDAHPNELDAAAARGWENGLRLIQRISANARYFTDSASKIPLEVGQGNAAAGMCIDFYGRSFAAELARRGGGTRLVWVAPEGGTTLSADPIAVLVGAPHPEIAQAFVEFCLSEKGQQLWFGKVGSVGGPAARVLHRMPIRRDQYRPAHLQQSTLPHADPYHDTGNFEYDPALTGAAFHTIRQLIRIMCIESHDELQAAWRALFQAGYPPEAMNHFEKLSPVSYAISGHGDPGLSSDHYSTRAARVRELRQFFRGQYQAARQRAERSP